MVETDIDEMIKLIMDVSVKDLLVRTESNYNKQTLPAFKGASSIPRIIFNVSFNDYMPRFELPPELKPKPVHQKYNWKSPCYPRMQKMQMKMNQSKYMRAPNHSKPMKK